MGLLSKINPKFALLIAIAICSIVYICLLNESFEGEGSIGIPPGQPATPCAPGYWCPASSSGSKDRKCPGGTYGSGPNSTPACSGVCKAGCSCPEGSTSECQEPCPPGYFCVTGTGGTAAPPIICPQGYYCPASSSAPTICPEAVFCPVGTSSIS